MTNQATPASAAEGKGTFESATDTAREALEGLPAALEQNPLAALLGGLALGAIAGALLPRSEREAELLGPLGSKIAEATRTATSAAREAGFGAFDQAGINKDAARDQVNKLIETATAAAQEAGAAAFKAIREGGAR